MRIHRLLLPLAAVSCLFMLTASAQAKSGTFKLSVTGTQSYSWSLDGTRGACEIMHGAGSGTNKFSFKSPKAAPIYLDTSNGLVGSVNATAKGTRSGSWGITSQTPCPGYTPSLPFTAEATGCSDFSYNLRMDFKPKGAFQYVTGPNQTFPTGICPSPVDSDLLFSNSLPECGDGTAQYKRSYGVSGAPGLLASKISFSASKLLKTRRGKTKSITGKSSVDCKPPSSSWSNPVTIRAELKYTLKFKRTG